MSKRTASIAFEAIETISDRIIKRRKLTKQCSDLKFYAPFDSDWREWVSATKTKNYILNDPLCDWLDNHYNKQSIFDANASHIKKLSSVENFTEYILGQGHIFEENVVNILRDRLGNHNVLSIESEKNFKSMENVNKTVNAMKSGIPVIHSGLLHNNITKTFGIPDLIVRSDWLKDIFDINPYTEEEEIINAPSLKSKYLTGFHYVIIDVKYTTLNLLADKTHLSNTGAIPAYKSQLHIYNEALSNIQGYKPDKAFILGRKWKYTIKKETYTGNNCFSRLGVIDYSGKDKHIIDKTIKAVEWVRKVRNPDARNWNITDYPLANPELYPNMSNQYDYPWRNVKKQISDGTKEITSLWMVGKKNRDICHSNGIYKWNDSNISADKLGIKGKYTKNIVDAVLRVNSDVCTDVITPIKIKNNDNGWQTKDNLEFYVDFETVNDVLDGINNTQFSGGTPMIFMIGVGYVDNDKGWIYKSFVAKSLERISEKEICNEMSMYIRNLADKYKVKNPKCLHWANAEETHWKSAEKTHFPFSKEWKSYEWKWFDLLNVFKSEPITVKGSLNFSLKNIAKSLKKHNCIVTDWDSASSCSDGKDAMIGAMKAYKAVSQKEDAGRSERLSIENVPIMKEIIKYNEVDVKVIYEIIDYLRKNNI